MKRDMKTMVKQAIAMMVCVLMVFSITACGRGTTSKKVNKNAKKITIQLFEGGHGRAWLDNIITAYEEKNGDVDITVKTTVSSIAAEALVNSGKSEFDLILLNYNFWNGSYEGKIEDLTDVYMATPEGESQTIMEKCNDTLVSYYNIGTADAPKFNQMSWASTNTGICYNQTTLDEVLGEGKWTLPNTTDEFLALCKEVQGDGSEAYAFVFNGQDDNYMDTYLIPAWTAQYMGYDAYYNYCHGKYQDANGEFVDASASEGKTLVEQNGSLPALKVFEEICTNYCHPYSVDLSFNNAQKVFCGYGSGVKTQKVAFMANGDWLESEIATLVANKPQDIKMMKLPVVSAIIDKCKTINDDATLSKVVAAIDSGATSCEGVSEADFNRIYEARHTSTSLSFMHCLAIPSTSQYVEEVKDFLVYMFSDEAQAIYSETLNGLTMPYGYDVSTNSNIKVSDFNKSVYEVFSGEHDIINVEDYSSKIVFFGGFRGAPTSASKVLFNKEATADSLFKDYVEKYSNRWGQILSQAGKK